MPGWRAMACLSSTPDSPVVRHIISTRDRQRERKVAVATEFAIEGGQAAPAAAHGAPFVPAGTPPVEQTVRAWHRAGRSQRAIARDLGIDRRKIKRIIDHPT